MTTEFAIRKIDFNQMESDFAKTCKMRLWQLIELCAAKGTKQPTFIISNETVHRNLESMLRPKEGVEIMRFVS